MTALTQERVKELFYYNLMSGELIRKSDRGGYKAGSIAGTKHNNGEIQVCVDKKYYRAHRVAWLWMLGELPEEIDHINGVRDDNRWINLRRANRSINQRNAPRRSDNNSGVTGVCLRSSDNKWVALISTEIERKHLGLFDDFFEAVCARKSAEIRYEYHPNHGRG